MIVFNGRLASKIYPSGRVVNNEKILNAIDQNYTVLDSVSGAGQYHEKYYIAVKNLAQY